MKKNKQESKNIDRLKEMKRAKYEDEREKRIKIKAKKMKEME